jgi:hypothetical protein
MDGRCETCRWWNSVHATSEWSGYTVYTSVALTDPSWRTCQLHSRHDEFPNTSRLLPQSSDPYVTSDVWTAPDFGCVQHEPKDANA